MVYRRFGIENEKGVLMLSDAVITPQPIKTSANGPHAHNSTIKTASILLEGM